MPKRLEINPQSYDIELVALSKSRESHDEHGMATVKFRFGEVSGETPFIRPELEKVGRWFLALAREVRQPRKKKAP